MDSIMMFDQNSNQTSVVSIPKQRKYKCPYCDQKLNRDKMPRHIDNEHEEMIPEGYTALRITFNTINHKTEGHCVICRGVTDWNENKGRYERLCNNKQCHDKYKKMVAERNKKKYGVERLQIDPRYAAEVQKKALAGRKISGTYKFSDGGELPYVGTYEKQLLEFMDQVMHCKSEDIIAPGPEINYYFEGKEHLYLPDFYYEPYRLLIEIKDGGDNPNNHPHRIEEEKKNKAKEAAVKKLNKYSYVRVVNNDFSQLLTVMALLKYNMADDSAFNPAIITNENSLLESDEKSILEKDHKQKGLLKLSDLELKVKEVQSKNNKEDYVGINLEWLSKDTNKPVCRVTVDKSPASDGYYWFGSLEVDKKYRGYGLGKQIVEFIKNKYKAGALAVAKDNEIAIKLYKSCGFKELERKDPNNKYYYLYYTPNRQKALKESTEDSNKQILIEDLNKQLNDFNYGIVVNGKIITENIDEDKYRTISYDDFLKYKTGSCWDYTNFEAIYFSNNFGMKLTKGPLKSNNSFSMYFMQSEDADGDMPSHTWVGYKLNNKIYSFESSWKQYAGITIFKTEDDMINIYIKRQVEYYKSQKNELYNHKVIKYSPIEKYGLTPLEFMRLVYKNGTTVYDKYEFLYRITSGGEGVYVPLKREMGKDEWLKFKKNPNCNWLPLPKIYEENSNTSFLAYFTKVGRDTFIQKTLPTCRKYLSEINEEIYIVKDNNSLDIAYEDDYQVLIPEKNRKVLKLIDVHNITNVNESAINESILINDDDLYYNKDKFDSGEINLCFIIGHAGSGKSTMLHSIDAANNKDIECYELDDLLYAKRHFTLEDLKKYGDLYYSFFTTIGKKYYIDKDDVKKQGIEITKYAQDLYQSFIPYAIEYARNHLFTKFVLDGLWLLIDDWFKPEDFKDYTVFIKGTSMIVSKFRATKRDSKGNPAKYIKKLMSYNFSRLKEEIVLKKWRRYFEGLMKKNESLEFPNPIDTVIFDIGKVLTQPNPESYNLIAKWQKKHNLTDEDIKAIFEAWDGHKQDYKEHQTLKEAKRLFRSFLDHKYHHLADDFFMMLANIARIVPKYAKQMLSSLKKKGYKLYFLSNMRQYIYELLESVDKFGPIYPYLLGGIFSFQTKYRKPDLNIYKILMKKFNINPETSLFLDDKPVNVEAARSLGFNSIVFEARPDSTANDTPIIKDLMNMPPVYSPHIEFTENMSGTIGAALPNELVPSYSFNSDYYLIQYPKNNAFAYGITKDPTQNTIYGVNKTNPNEYKAYKTDKSKIGKKYLTYRIKDEEAAEALYNELALRIKHNQKDFVDLHEDSENYVYAKLSENSNSELILDPKFELIENPNKKVQQLCNRVYSYLKGPMNLDLLDKQVNDLVDEYKNSLSESKQEENTPNNDKNSSSEIPVEFYNDWESKMKKVRDAESAGMIIMIPRGMRNSSITADDIDDLKLKHHQLQGITSHKRVLSNQTASSIFGVDNDRLYSMITNAYSRQSKDQVEESTIDWIDEDKYIAEKIINESKNSYRLNSSNNASSLEPVFIILYANDRIHNRIIRRITHSRYSHVELSFDSSLSKMYSYSSAANGMTITDNRKNIANAIEGQAEIKVYAFFVTKKQKQKMIKATMDYANSINKTHYNFKLLFDILLQNNTNYENPYTHICSSFVYSILSIANLHTQRNKLMNKMAITPADFDTIVDDPRYYVVYQGKNKDYKQSKIDKTVKQLQLYLASGKTKLRESANVDDSLSILRSLTYVDCVFDLANKMLKR